MAADLDLCIENEDYDETLATQVNQNPIMRQQLESVSKDVKKDFHYAAFSGNLSGMEKLYSNSTSKCLVLCKKNKTQETPLHFACRSTSSDNAAKVIEQLIQWDEEYKREKVDKDSIDTRLMENINKNIPLHIACCSSEDDHTMVEALLHCDAQMIENQLSIKTGYFGNTALHLAAWNNNVKVLKCILKAAKNARSELRNNNINLDSPVHLAAEKGHVKILQVMHSYHKGCFHNNLGRFNWSVLHTACAYGQLEAVKMIVSLTAKDVPENENDETNYEMIKEFNEDILDACCADVKPDMKLRAMVKPRIDLKHRSSTDKKPSMTPLTIACMFGHVDIVVYLLSVGYRIKMRKPEYPPINQEAFIRALDENHEECVKQIVLHSDYKQLCDFLIMKDSEGNVKDNVYLFNKLIVKMPKVAKCILDKSVEFNPFKSDESPDWRDHDESCKVVMNYDFIYPTSSDDLFRHHSNTNSQTLKQPLKTMIETDNIELLKHPVVASFIYNIWNSRYGVVNFIYWAVYFFYLLIITAVLIWVLPNPTSAYCNAECANETTYNSIITNYGHTEELSVSSKAGLNLLAGLMLLYSVVRLFVFEMYQCLCSVYLSCKKNRVGISTEQHHWLEKIKKFSYIQDYSNWLEIPLFILSIIYAIIIFIANSKSFCLSGLEWQIGIVITCLSWIELILISRQFKLVGVQAQTFWKVCTTLFEFFPFAIFLFAAFGFSFYLLLYQCNMRGSPYSSPFYSVLSVYAMLGGYADFNSVFGLDGTSDARSLHLQYEVFTFLFWALSLFIITIILTNIMIGLAVENINEIYKAADDKRLKLQVKYITEMYETLLVVLICKPSVGKTKTNTPFKFSLMTSLRKKAVFFLWGGSPFDSKDVIDKINCCQLQWPKVAKASADGQEVSCSTDDINAIA